MATIGHDPAFDSAWLKWAWAIVHTERFRQEQIGVAQHADGQPGITTLAEYNSKRRGFVVTVLEAEPLPIQMGLMVGDIASNYRASLDHLAWALVNRGTLPLNLLSANESRRVKFPIARSPADLRSDDNLRLDRYGRAPLIKKGPNRGKPNLGCLPGVRRGDLTIVRACQPYSAGAKLIDLHSLAILVPLNNFDKHRGLQPAQSFSIGGKITIGDPVDCIPINEIRSRVKAVPVEVGQELLFIPAKKAGPRPDLYVHVDLTAEVCLDNGAPVLQWAAKTGAWINQMLLSRFSAPDKAVLAALPGFLDSVRP